MLPDFKSLADLFKHFPTQESCIKYLEVIRWGVDGDISCAFCEAPNAYRTATGYKCKKCLKKFSIRTGTFMEGTKMPLQHWFVAVHLAINCGKGVSSPQLAKSLNITQKSAWFMLHRIREMLKERGRPLLDGDVEIDEAWIGGKERFKHRRKKAKNQWPPVTHFELKTPVIGILQRGGRIVVKKIQSVSYKALMPVIVNTIHPSACIHTDEGSGYSSVHKVFKKHLSVIHSKGQYAAGKASCNGVENFWSILKRGLKGTYHSVSRKHLDRYCTEFAFRHNYRSETMSQKFHRCMSRCTGRLKYKDLISSV